MTSALQLIGVAAAAFASTSVDSFGVLVALFAARDLQPWRVACGYLGAVWIVTGAAWAGSKAVEFLPVTDFGILGLIPLGLGIERAWRLLRSEGDAVAVPPSAGGVVVVALVTLAQSADNAMVYLSLFADSASRLDSLLFVSLAACAAAWCGLAFWLARHSPLARSLQRAMRFALPILLLGVGAYILSATVTDVHVR